ncbi:MAG: AI-2E family transporter [Lachnospiraceae bacterium]|nr:AI-2E family transporter [Lachnospiraceae bacterium]
MADIEDNNRKKTLSDHVRNIFGIVVKYFKFSLIDSVIIGVANYVFMWLMHMPHGILISIIIGITNLIPNVGPVAGAIVGGVILMFYEVKQALWFLLFTVVLQILDSLLIKPKLFGKSFGVSGIVMLLAMLVGGGVFGIVGMILVVPAVAIIQYLYKNVLRSGGKDQDTQDGE